jgi:hypothetical protein
MRHPRSFLFGVLGIIALLIAAIGPLHPTDAQADSRYFPETQHYVKGLFLKYWTEHGGLAQQGYPLTEEFQEQSTLDGKTYTVQYFERAVFENHPENKGTPYEVLLTQLGKYQLDGRYPNGSNPAAAAQPPPGSSGQPTAAPTVAAPAPTAPPASGQVDLVQSANYKDAIGSLWFVGVARNNTGKQLSGAEIVLTLLDVGGKTVASAKDFNYDTALIQPGALMPFRILVSNPPASWANVRWQIVPKPYDPTTFLGKTLYNGLAAEDVSLQPPANQYASWTLVGQVKNSGSQIAQYVHISAAAYDAGGTLLDVDDTYTKLDVLNPGDSSPFEIQFNRRDMQPARQDVFVKGSIKQP